MVRIVAVGDNVVDCYMAQGRMFPGGNCLNVSVFARLFGAATATAALRGAMLRARPFKVPWRRKG